MSPQTALFTDFDNICLSADKRSDIIASFLQEAGERAKTFGPVKIARAYANFTKVSADIQMLISASGSRLIHCPAFPNGSEKLKSLTDSTMMVDIFTMFLDHSSVRTFFIVTGDIDFHPLFVMLRSRGRKVVCMAMKPSASRYIADAVDEFILYPLQPNSLTTDQTTPPTAVPSLVAEDNGQRRDLIKAGLIIPS